MDERLTAAEVTCMEPADIATYPRIQNSEDKEETDDNIDDEEAE